MMQQLSLIRIVAVLASAPGQPVGDTTEILEFLADLTVDGWISAERWAAVADGCRARRVRGGREEWTGLLVREEGRWALRPRDGGEDVPWFILVQRLRPGEYLTLQNPNGDELGFRIVNVETA